MSYFLFKPIRLGRSKLKNRIGLAPLNTGLIPIDGSVSKKCIEFYSQYLQNDIGLLIIGGIAINEKGKANASTFVLDNINKANCLKRLIELAKSSNVCISIQLEHAGRQAWPNETGYTLVAPSPLPCPVVNEMPRELTIHEIREIITDFQNASQICQEIGADFVEIHGAHGYLISSFLSPVTNKREDEYGGSLFGRFKILYDIITSIKDEIDIDIGVRINCSDNMQGGLTLTDIQRGLSQIKSKISYVSLSGGMYSKNNDVIMPSIEQGIAIWKDCASSVRSALNLPVLLAGNIRDINTANRLIKDKNADLILMGRALLADPKLIVKTVSNRIIDIQKCDDCRKCKYHSFKKKHIYCPYNPVVAKIE